MFINEVIRQCQEHPERICVVDEVQGQIRRSTYGDFWRVVEQTVTYMAQHQVAPGSFVVISLPNSMEYLAIEYGVWLSGCAIAPVSPLYPKARIDYIANHCEAALVVDEAVLQQILGQTASLTDRFAEGVRRMDCFADSSQIAALFYTSGSTGTPKGVIHTMETLSHIDQFDTISQVTPDDCFGLGSPMSFIACMFTVPYLRCGGSIRLLSRETMTDAAKLQHSLDHDGITGIFLNPSALKQLDLRHNTTLQYVITGSERVSRLQSQAHYKLVCLYGMTESAGMISTFPIDRAYENTPIGQPLSDLTLRVAEDGEICLQGPLSPGYYKDEERTAQLWQDGWFHTGDLGRLLPDGNLEYVNRKDWMIKINGQRVETGEISSVMQQVEGVVQAVAKGFTSADGHAYIVGYYVAKEGVTEEAIRRHLSEHLAPYMMPTFFVQLDNFPRVITGKVDMNALQSPMEINTAREIVLPENETQERLCSAFATTLGISPISIDDDFFALGGDSIRVMQLQTLCPEWGLTTDTIYRCRTPRKIAASILENLENLERLENLDSLENKLLQGHFPLSQAQMGIYIECMTHRGEALYNNPFLYRLASSLDLQRVAAAVEQTLQAHPGLWAKIEVDENGMPYQRLDRAVEQVLKVEKVTAAEWEQERTRLVQPFDLMTDRLFRVRLIQTETDAWLFVDLHHIVFDGSSNVVLLHDLEQAYLGQDIAPEAVTAFDWAQREQHLRATATLDECREWYLSHFSEPDETTLPAPDRFEDEIQYRRLEIDEGLTEVDFDKTAARLGVTGNILSLAAFGYMLGACNHGQSSAFATIYNGRKSLDTARTVAMMVKTLPVYCQWQAQTTIGDYLQAVKEQMTGAMAHDLYSFAEVCAKTAYDSRIIFSYQDEMLAHNTLCGEECERIDLQDHATSEPLTVQLYKQHGKMIARVEYRTNMYTETYLRTLIGCFYTILSSFSHLDKQHLTADLRLVDAATEQTIIQNGWGRSLPVPTNETIVEAVRRHAQQTPDAVAVVDCEGHYTYGELDRLSDALAQRLIEMGVGEEDFVGLMLPRQRLFPLAFMAVFKAGGAYVPMDNEYPVDRLQYMLEDSQSKVLITTRAIYEDKQSQGEMGSTPVLYLDEVLETLENLNSLETLAKSLRPERLAYMIYTSGTTGKPKGVMIEHRALNHFMAWMQHDMGITAGTRVAEHASFSFDASVCDLMPTLAAGGELHILSEELRKEPEALYHYLADNRIEGMTATTQLGAMLVRAYDLPLRYIILGGEKLSGTFHTKVRLINGYGPTEFTVCSSYQVVDTEHTPENIPIGKAVPNSLSAIVDALGRILPIGIAGELVLIGAQMARGYWHREDITAQRFAPCQFVAHERMYHTGDLVRWDASGELIYMGRIDTQVKLRGFRIELGEVESTMLRYEGLQQAVVAVKEIGGMQHLCGYYTAAQTIDETALRTFLSASLTDYMVPTALVHMDSMPMTPNGKIDVRALPLPDIQAEEIVAPANEQEQQLWDIVAQQLGNDAFGVTTNLITMGLTSLGAISLSVVMEKQLGLHLPSTLLLQQPTIREWTNRPDRLLIGAEAPTNRCATKAEQRDYPLTDNQVGIYIDWEQHRDTIQYNVPMVLHFHCDANQLSQAVHTFLQAHPYLQTRLQLIQGEVRQVRSTDPVDIPVTTLKNRPNEAFFQSRIRPFDLLSESLCRMEIYTYHNECWLLSDIHHILFDGGSEGLLVSQIVTALQGQTLPAEQLSAYDYALYYEQWMQSPEKEAAKHYFDQLLDGVHTASLQSEENDSASASQSFALTLPREPIRAYCRRCGVTENAFFLTAITQTLHRFTREKNLAITTVSNGRSLASLANTTGMFVQTLPVVSHDTQQSIEATLQSMHRQMIDTLTHDKYPFTRLSADHDIQATILMAYEGDIMQSGLQVNGQAVELTTLSLNTAKVPIAIAVTPTEDEVSLFFEYDGHHYAAPLMEQWAHAVQAMAMNLVAANPKTLITSVSCVLPEQQATILTQSYGGDLTYDTTRTLPHWVDTYAAEMPAHEAVVDAYGSLSYSELAHRASIIAHILRAQGVHKDTMVGIMLPRIKEFLVSVIGIHKAGGAYVPLDSEYPNERLAYMLENSEAPVLITTHELYATKQAEGDFVVPQVLYIDDIDWTQTVAPINEAQTDGLAYMIYTSGSTGRPKGTMLEHRNLMAFAGWRTRTYFTYQPDDNFLCHPSFCFDASICDLLVPLFAGSTVHILHDNLRKDLDGIAQYIAQHHIVMASMPTQLGMALLNSADLPMRFLEMGGEKLVPTKPSKVQKINGYGPTEFTVCSSYHLVQDDETDIPIGRPAPNTWSVIVDPEGQILPPGVAGELCLIGNQIARGYWHLPEKTEQVFTPCPFLPGQRMYHTGDLARYNEQGELCYLGRIDFQVKLRGFRIEMGEIENQMASFPSVTGAIAMVQEIGGTQHLVGYFTATQTIDTAALKAHLQQSLTSYMVPDALMQLPAFPLTPNGKIDRKRLPLPSIERSTEYVAPRNELEQQLCNIFTQITGTSQVGIHDDFFEIGGTSLLAIKAVIDITNLGRKIVYGDLFRLKTPAAIAAHLDPSLSTEQEADAYYRFADYDYTAIDRLLQANHLPDDEMQPRPLGTVLLTGATGFLGIHILDYLMRHTDSDIYCLIRPRGDYSGESRLKTMMVYYLTDTHSDAIGTRIHVIEDDITNPDLASTLSHLSIDTIFNAAALVKHFAVGKEMDEVNVAGVDHLISVAEQLHACLIHVSTYSTAGVVPSAYTLPYSEQQLYIGQCTDNEYIRTKFLSERLVLQAIADGRIAGKVMRVGNLMARMEDGEFQINMHANAFLNNIRSFKALGVITADIMSATFEMSPIDYVAQAIARLATTPQEMVLFHPYNRFSICRSVLVDELAAMGYPIRLVTPTAFRELLQAAMQDENRSDDMQGIIHYTTNQQDGLSALSATNDYTTQTLLWLGFRWPMTTNQYIRSLLTALDGLAFFD